MHTYILNSMDWIGVYVTVGLFFSGDIMVFDVLHLCFSKCNTYIIAGNITQKDNVEIFTYFLWKSLTEKRTKRLALSVLR